MDSRMTTRQQRHSPARTIAPVWIAIAIPLSAFIAYAPAVKNGFIWDDDRYVVNNELLANRGGLRKIWLEIGATDQYYPLTYTTFWIEKRVWGDSPSGYHVINILLHAVNAVLVWRLLALLGIPGAALAGLLFAVHPLHVESVAWITERKNTLSLLFYLLAALAYARFDGWRGYDATTSRRWGAYVVTIGLFALALLSKSAVATLPAAILLIVWWRRGRLGIRDIVPTLPMFGLAIASGYITVLVESSHVSLETGDAVLAWPSRLIVAGRATWFYLGKLAWPHPLCFTYPRWSIDPSNVMQYLDAFMAGALVVGLTVTAKRIGRGVLTAVLFYGGSLLPVLGFVDVYAMRYSFVADHFAYLPSIGLITLAAAGLVQLAPAMRNAARFGPLFLAAPLVALCWQHCGAFRDLESLWTDTLRKNPAAYMAHTNLGIIMQQRGDVDGALAHYQTALQLKPDLFNAHYNAAIALDSKGLLLDAGRHYEKALDLRPDFANGHFNYALLLSKSKNHDAAAAHLLEVLRIMPSDNEARFKLGCVYADAGKLEEAVREIKKALKAMPESPIIYARLAQVYYDMGDLERADAFFRAALKRKADYAYAHHGLGRTLERLGRTADAVTSYREALRLDPARLALRDHIAALEHLGTTTQPAPSPP